MDQALIEQIVANVLTQLQRAPIRSVAPGPVVEPKPSVIEITTPIVTASYLAETIRGQQPVRISRKSIVTPSARDWLNSKKIAWSRGDAVPSSATSSASVRRARWQLVLQTVTPTVRALQDGLKRNSEGWKVELVGKPQEAASLAVSSLGTAEAEGVVIVSEFADVIACRVNRNEKVRAAVVTDRRQLEQAHRLLGINLVCINPNGRTFIELRNLLRDCAAVSPQAPSGWN